MIKYLDIDRADYQIYQWMREDIDSQLEGKQIINVETKKDFIRFWYKTKE